MNFLFPQHLEQFQRTQNPAHLEELIKHENMLLTSTIRYRCAIRKQKYIYARCKFRNCSAFMTYHHNEDSFALVKFNNSHSHSSAGTRAALYKQIEEEISELPLSTSTATAKHIILNRYKIEQFCFYYLYRKVKNRKITYLQLTDLLNQKKYEVQSDPYYFGMNQLPDLMVAISPLMKENFNHFGHWMGFDFTHNLIQDRSEDGKQWRIGIFTGISSSKKIVPFGLVVSNEESKQRFVQILKAFTDIMNGHPQVIISDQDSAFQSAIQILRAKRQFDGVHLLDCFHIIRNVKKNLVVKDNWKYFNQMIRERSVERFEKIKDECLMEMHNDKDIETLKRFVYHADRYCFCRVPNALFGFLPNSSMNEKIHDLIKGIIPYSKPFTVVVKKILLYLEELGLKCHEFELDTVKYEDLFHFPALKQIRFTVCKSILKEIVREVSLSFHHEIFKVTEQKYIIKNIAHKEYFLAHDGQKWRCSCEYLTKTGIFCSHLAKLLMSMKIQLLAYINLRWKMNIDRTNLVKKKYYYQRKTRRNTKK